VDVSVSQLWRIFDDMDIKAHKVTGWLNRRRGPRPGRRRRIRGYTVQYLFTTLLVVPANIRKLRASLAEASAASDGQAAHATSYAPPGPPCRLPAQRDTCPSGGAVSGLSTQNRI